MGKIIEMNVQTGELTEYEAPDPVVPTEPVVQPDPVALVEPVVQPAQPSEPQT